ncbi:MarR family transcriptional regulator [Nocardioides mangrovicus]|uniref:MarR family transcriptional regulator n=1 Tax=Nocardioides mangrovicus TaxID=2478913 RepID=A0A3L8P587_9ACTN|nr:MarR family transcriptional regulator [Nocardioides mangrovicus]RLV50212.1 MarR family transcriptional regulator [Nocardioides mangrovicus]
MTESASEAAHAVRVVVGRLRRRLREVAGDEELTPSQTSALGRLMREEPMSASALAAAEGVRPQSMAATLDVLHQRGLVERSPDPTDGRRHDLWLTEAAHEFVAGSRRSKEEWLSQALGTLTEAERRTVIEAMALLERLA